MRMIDADDVDVHLIEAGIDARGAAQGAHEEAAGDDQQG